MALSPNGENVLCGYADGTMRVWDVETGIVFIKWVGDAGSVWSLCWSPDGKRLVSGSSDGTARVRDVKSGKTVVGPIKTGHESVLAIVCSPDDTKFATVGYDESAVKIWDSKTGKLLTTLTHDYSVRSLAWTSDGNKLLCSSLGLIRIFDTATWYQIAILEGHTNHVVALSLSQNDRLLASASDDKTARLWNLDTNLPVGPPLKHGSQVQCAALSADGKILVTGCEDKNVYLWDIETILKEADLKNLPPPDTKIASVDIISHTLSLIYVCCLNRRRLKVIQD
jgi:WD40 repeat protein